MGVAAGAVTGPHSFVGATVFPQYYPRVAYFIDHSRGEGGTANPERWRYAPR